MKLIDDVETLGADMVLFAIEESVANNKRSYKYMEAIMKAWRKENVTTVEQAKARSKQWDERRGNRGKGGKPRATSKRVDQSNEYASRGEW